MDKINKWNNCINGSMINKDRVKISLIPRSTEVVSPSQSGNETK